MAGLTVHTDRIIVILYEKAIMYLERAIRELDENLPTAGENIKIAQDIIIDLDSSLDLKSGSNVAKNLNRIYNFLTRHLTKANVSDNPQMLREAIAVLEDLCQSWKTISTG
jgi:flagellar protein FliS